MTEISIENYKNRGGIFNLNRGDYHVNYAIIQVIHYVKEKIGLGSCLFNFLLVSWSRKD